MTGMAPPGQHFCDRCEDSGVVPPGDFADGDTCPNCDGDPLNALPHEDRPHPDDYDCPECGVGGPSESGGGGL